MPEKRIVITGVGVIASNGIGKEEFWQSLREGKTGIKKITAFDTTQFKVHTAGEVKDFNPEIFLDSKGLKDLDRTTQILCSGVSLALKDSKLEISERNTRRIGVVTATTLSLLYNFTEFIKDSEKNGPRFVNPSLFPGITINFPSSQVGIRFHIKGFNTTVSTGFTASLDALKYAVDFIKFNRADIVIVAGVEALLFQSFLGYYSLGFLAGLKGEEISCPFDKRHNGIVMGEGAGVLVIESEISAGKRNAYIYGEVGGFGNYFDAYRASKYDPRAQGLKNSMSRAVKASRIKIKDIGYISSAANSVPLQDRLEAAAIRDVFGKYSSLIPVSSIKSMVGETMSAAGMLQIISSLQMLHKGFIPPAVNCLEPDKDCYLNLPGNKPMDKKIKNFLINNYGPGGNNASVVIKAYN